MADIQDQINRILSDPDALKQVQSLGEQLGLTGSAPREEKKSENALSVQGLSSLASLAPLLNGSGDDEVSRLLTALRPFLGEEKRRKLDRASQIIKFARLIPLIKDSGILK